MSSILSEAAPVSGMAAPRQTAGAWLRDARQRHGLHIVALAATLKVHPSKLEALEADRWDELPDTTFVRALAKSICRVLKIDASPVLALLPNSEDRELTMSRGLNRLSATARPGRAVSRWRSFSGRWFGGQPCCWLPRSVCT